MLRPGYANREQRGLSLHPGTSEDIMNQFVDSFTGKPHKMIVKHVGGREREDDNTEGHVTSIPTPSLSRRNTNNNNQ